MSDVLDHFARLFGPSDTSESEATRLLRDLERANAQPEPERTISLTLTVSEAAELEALLSYVPSLVGECKDALTAWKFRTLIAVMLDAELDR